MNEKISFGAYQDFTETTAVYKESLPTFNGRLSYVALGLTGEAGEVAEKIKKLLRDGTYVPEDITRELGDVLYYITQMSSLLGVELEEVAAQNMAKLLARKSAGTIRGSGDYR